MKKDRLTERKKEIIKLVSKGYSDKKIAEELNIAYRTVSVHLSQIFYMLNVNNRAELVTWGFKNGILK